MRTKILDLILVRPLAALRSAVLVQGSVRAISIRNKNGRGILTRGQTDRRTKQLCSWIQYPETGDCEIALAQASIAEHLGGESFQRRAFLPCV